jgi:serine/threonine-protein kinase
MGVILFELLTGRPVFQADDDFDLIDMHVNEDPPSLTAIDPSLPAALDSVIRIALAKYPAERFADAASMAKALEDAARAIP